MRAAFTRTLIELAERDPRVLLLTGDLGFSVLEPFAARFPGRFFNVGVAEQNMLGLVTGLAEAGFIPYVYSIAPFVSLRPYEFIRNGPVLHQLPVRIVGVGGGFDYSHNGASHYALEDVGALRILSGISVIAPADHEQARTALLSTWDVVGPVYYRLGKDDKTTVPGLDGRFEIGRVQIVRKGPDLLLITMGSIASEATAAADALARAGVSTTLAIVASVSPPPTDDLIKLLARFPAALTVEAHYVVGGVGSLVSEIVAENGLRCQVKRCGVKTPPDGRSGSQNFLHARHGLTAGQLVESALNLKQATSAVH